MKLSGFETCHCITGCFLEWYCGADCQKADWDNHKVAGFIYHKDC